MREERLTYEQASSILGAHGISDPNRWFHRLIGHAAYDWDSKAVQATASALQALGKQKATDLDDPDVLAAVLRRLVRSGRIRPALKLYHNYSELPNVGGGYKVLGRKRGLFRKGLALTRTFFKDIPADVQDTQIYEPEVGVPNIVHDRALFLIELGKLAEAEAILREPLISQADGPYLSVEGKSLYQFPARLNLCDILILSGKLDKAHYLVETMIKAFESGNIDYTRYSSQSWTQAEQLLHRVAIGEYIGMYQFTTGFNPYARRAVVETLWGRVDRALLDFKRAEKFQRQKFKQLRLMQTFRRIVYEARVSKEPGEPSSREADLREADQKGVPTLMGQAAVFYAMLLTRLGKLRTAESILAYSRRWAAHPANHFPGMVAYADVALSDVYRLLGDETAALRQLEHPLAWSEETEQKEIACWAHLSRARLRLAMHRLDEAQADVDAALGLALAHRFRLYEIDCRVTAGRIAFLQQDWDTARKNVGRALDDAADPDCRYVWAYGNALHLLAEINRHPEYAAQLASQAIRIRMRIRDPRLTNSQELLNQIIERGR